MLRSLFSKIKSPRAMQVDSTTEQPDSSPVSGSVPPNSISAMVRPVHDGHSTLSHNAVTSPPELLHPTQITSVLPTSTSSSHSKALSRLNCLRQWRHDLAVLRHKLSVYIDAVDAVAAAGISLGRSGKALSTDVSTEGTIMTAPPAPVSCRCDNSPCSCWAAHTEALEAFHASLAVSVRCAWESLREAAKGEGAGVVVGGGGGVIGAGAAIGAGVDTSVNPRIGQVGASARRDSDDAGRAGEGEGVVGTVRAFHDAHGDIVLGTIAAWEGIHRLGDRGPSERIPTVDGGDLPSACGAPRTLALFPPPAAWPSGVWARRTHAYVEAWEEDLRECEALVTRGVEEEQLAARAIERVNELLVRRAEAIEEVEEVERQRREEAAANEATIPAVPSALSDVSLSTFVDTTSHAVSSPIHAHTVGAPSVEALAAGGAWSLDDEAVLRHAKAVLGSVIKSAESARSRTDRAWARVCVHGVRARELSVLLARAVAAVWHHAGLGAVSEEEGAGWAGVGAGVGVSVGLGAVNNVGSSNGGRLRWLGPGGSDDDSEEAEEGGRGRAQAYVGGGAQAVFNSLFNATVAPRAPSAGWSAPSTGGRGTGTHAPDASDSDGDGEGVGAHSHGRGSESDGSSVGVLLSPARVPKSTYYNQLYRQLSHTRARTRARTQSSAYPHPPLGDGHDAQSNRKNSLEYPQRRISQAGKPGDGVSGSASSERVERGETLVERVARMASAALHSTGVGGVGARSIFRAEDVFASASSDEWESDEWEGEEGWGEAEDPFWLEGEREEEGASEDVEKGEAELADGHAADALTGAEAKAGVEAAAANVPEVSASAAPVSSIPPAPVIAGLNDVPPGKSTIPPAPLFSEIYGPDVPIPVISSVVVSKSAIPPAPILSGMSGIPPPPSLASLGIPPPPALAGLGIPPPPQLGAPPAPTLAIFPTAAPQAPWERLGLRAPLMLPGGGRGLRRLHWEVVGDVERAVGPIGKGAQRGAEVDEVVQLLLRAFRVCVIGAEDADVASQPRRADSTDATDDISAAEVDEPRTGAVAGVGVAKASVQLAKHALTTALGPDALAGAGGAEDGSAEEKADEEKEGAGIDSLWRRVQLLRAEEERMLRATENAKSLAKQCEAPSAAVDEKRDAAAHDEKREGVHDNVADASGVATDGVVDTGATADAGVAIIEGDGDERRSGCLSLIAPLMETMPPHIAQYVRKCVQLLPPAVCAELGQLSVVSLGTLTAEDRWVSYEAAAARSEGCGRDGCGAAVDDSVLAHDCLQARARARARASRGEPAVCVEASAREEWATVEALMAAAPLIPDEDLCVEATCAALARAWTLPFVAEAAAKVGVRGAGRDVDGADSEAHTAEGTEEESELVDSVAPESQEVAGNVPSSASPSPSVSTSLSATTTPSPHPYSCLCAAHWATQLRTLLLVGLVRRAIAMQRQRAPCGGAALCGVEPVTEQITLAFDVERARARREKAKKRETMAKAAKEEAVCLLGPKRGYTLAIAARGLRPLTPLLLVQLLLAADVSGIASEGEDGDGGVWGAWAASEPAVDAFLRDEEGAGDADASLLLQGVLCEYSEHMARVEREAMEEGEEGLGIGAAVGTAVGATMGAIASNDGSDDEDDEEECYLSPLARRQPSLRHLRLRLTPAHASVLLTLADMLARASALLPAEGEAELLRTYTGPLSEVAAGEQLALAAARESAVAVHVRVLDVGRDAAVTAREVCVSALGVARACVEVLGSTALTALSRVVLDLGNALNTGTKAGSASAVRCSVWERVAGTRTADGTPMIEYIGDLCLTTCPRALRLPAELPSLRQWATVDGAGMQAKVEALCAHATLIAAVLAHYFVSALPLSVLTQEATDSAEAADASTTIAISDDPATAPPALEGMLILQGETFTLAPELSRAVAAILASAETKTDVDTGPVNPDVAVKLHTLARVIQRHCHAGDMHWKRARVPGQSLRLQPAPQQLCRRLLALHSHVARVAALAHSHMLLASRCVAAASVYLCERPPAPNAWHLCVCGLCACVELLQAQWKQARERAWRRMRARRREVDGWVAEMHERREDERVVEGTMAAMGTTSTGKGSVAEATVGGRDRNVSVGGVMARMRHDKGLQRRLRQVAGSEEGQ